MQTLPSSLFKRLDAFSLNTKRKTRGLFTGSRASSKKGHGIEFADYRDYQPGDNIRHIDWNLFARSDRTYVKTFQEEQSLEILIIVDGSASMHAVDAQKWQYIKDLTLALSYIAFSDRERVTVKILGKTKLGPLASVSSLPKIAQALTDATSTNKNHEKLSSFEESFEKNNQLEIVKTLEHAKYPAICVLISDFLYEETVISKTFKLLGSRNFDLVAIQTLGAKDIAPMTAGTTYLAVDSETNEQQKLTFNDKTQQEYSRYLNTHIASVKRHSKQSKAHYVMADTREDLFELLKENLTRVGLLR